MTSGHYGEMPGMGVAVLDSLRGLALGDGFGERWFHRSNREAIEMIKARQLPSEAPWYWTDDTAMALTVVRMLRLHGRSARTSLPRCSAPLTKPTLSEGTGTE